MSESSLGALASDDPAVSRPAAEALLDAGRTGVLVEWIVDRLMGDSSWARRQTLELLFRLPPRAPLLDSLVAGLVDEAHPERRNAARSALAALAAPGALDPASPLSRLTALLEDPRADARILAALSLGESGNPRVREALQGALHDPEPNVAAAAAEALGELGDPRAVDALLEIAAEGSFWTRSAAVVALGQLGDPRAVPVLARLLGDRWLAAAAAAALGEIGGVAALELLREGAAEAGAAREAALEAAARILARHPSTAAPDWLRRALRTQERALAERFARDGDAESARLLGLTGTGTAARTLLDPRNRRTHPAASTVGLEHLPERILREAVLERLPDVETSDQAMLLDTLPPLDDPGAISQIAAYLAAPSQEVRAAAAEVLARSPAAPVLRELERLRSRPEARQGVAMAYGRMRSERCSPLLELLRDPDPAVRAAAAAGVGQCGLNAVAALREALHREADARVRRALVSALGKEGGEESVAELENALASDDVALRFEAVRALGRTGSGTAFPVLVRALDDSAPEVRVAALSALGELGDVRAGQTLARHLHDPDRDHRRVATLALDRLTPPGVEERIGDALGDPDREIRLLALDTLSRLGARGSLAAIERLAAEDPDRLVRRAAARVAAALQDSAGGASP